MSGSKTFRWFFSSERCLFVRMKQTIGGKSWDLHGRGGIGTQDNGGMVIRRSVTGPMIDLLEFVRLGSKPVAEKEKRSKPCREPIPVLVIT